MKRFKNILFVAENRAEQGSSLTIAASVAKQNKANLTVVSVVRDLSAYLNILPSSSRAQEIEDEVMQDHIDRLDHMTAPWRGKGLRISRKILRGTPFLEIIRQVLRKGHDLVILTPRGEGKLSEMLVGSTTMHLMRKCPCPVWVIKRGQKERFSSILAALDFVPSDSSNESLNRKIMEVALSLSRLHKSELHIVHAWDADAKGLRIPLFPLHEISGELKKSHEKWFQGLARKYAPDAPDNRIHFSEGDPADVITEFAMEREIDLIVMGTLSRSGIPGLFIGNTAEKILHRINCSVLAVKPDGFVSPVEAE